MQQCPVRDAAVNICKKKGQYVKVCYSKMISEVNVSTETDKVDDDLFLGSLSADKVAELWISTIKMDNCDTEFKLDGDADVTAIPCELDRQGQFNKLESYQGLAQARANAFEMPRKIQGLPLQK